MPDISLENFSAGGIRNLVETREREKHSAESAVVEQAKARRDELRKARAFLSIREFATVALKREPLRLTFCCKQAHQLTEPG